MECLLLYTISTMRAILFLNVKCWNSQHDQSEIYKSFLARWSNGIFLGMMLFLRIYVVIIAVTVTDLMVHWLFGLYGIFSVWTLIIHKKILTFHIALIIAHTNEYSFFIQTVILTMQQPALDQGLIQLQTKLLPPEATTLSFSVVNWT